MFRRALAPCPDLTDVPALCPLPSPCCRFTFFPLTFPIPLAFHFHYLSVSRFSFLDVIPLLTFILSFHTCRDSSLILSRLSTYTLSFPTSKNSRITLDRHNHNYNSTDTTLQPLNSLVSIHPTIDSTEAVLHRSAPTINFNTSTT